LPLMCIDYEHKGRGNNERGGPMQRIQWETFDGETTGYFDDGSEIAITARTRYNRWGGKDSSTREWFVTDPDNNRIASGTADGLREAKKAAIHAFSAYSANRARKENP